MAEFYQDGRVGWVEGPGHLYVVSDLHGNLHDFLRIVEIWEQDEDACLLFLGDLFHGPYLTEAQWAPYRMSLGDYYYDQSAALFRCYLKLKERYPTRVRALLGNHEHAHVGGPRVAKFTPDEAYSFEANLQPSERISLLEELAQWPWIVGSRCGVAFTHGAPPPTPFNRSRLDSESLYVEDPQRWVVPGTAILSELLWRRCSPPQDVEQFLNYLSDITELPQNVVVYGHEPCPGGYEVEHEKLFNLSTSFAMRRAEKCYLRIPLDHYLGNSLDVESHIISLYAHNSETLVDHDQTIDEEADLESTCTDTTDLISKSL